MEKLEMYFRSVGFHDDDVKVIMECFIPKSIRKGEYFVEEGKTSRHMGFIDRGFLQYYVNIDGEEKTTYSIVFHRPG